MGETEGKFDVFMCHNSEDKPAVEAIAIELIKKGLKPWLDEWQLRPGFPWQDALEEQIESVRAAAVFVGNSGFGPWQEREQKAFLSEFVERDCPVIPVILPGCDEAPKLPTFLKAMRWVDFRSSAPDPLGQSIWGITGNNPHTRAGRAKDLSGHPTNKVARMLLTPSHPPHFIRRDELLEHVVGLVLAESKDNVAITGKQTIGVFGMGGIGKSVLATDVARDRRIVDRFVDGVHWLTVGASPNLASLQSSLATAFGKSISIADPESGKDRLRELLEDKATLLILDDVWKRDHALSLDLVGTRGRVLITTRDARILTAVGASKEVCVETLDERQAIALLEEWSGESIADSVEALSVIEECGRLPLALSICGAMIRDGDTWNDLNDALKDVDIDFLEKGTAFDHGVFQSLALSVDRMIESDSERYLELAVFPSDETIAFSAVSTLWRCTANCTERFARKLLRGFHRASLLSWDDAANTVSFHDLQHDFLLAKKRDSLAELHSSLLDAYSNPVDNDWAAVVDDGYIENHLCYHLSMAGRSDERKNLLCDFRWLQRRVDCAGVASLLLDFSGVHEHDELKQLEDAIRLSSHVVASKSNQLPSQLENRLLSIADPAIKSCRASIRASTKFAWLSSLAPTLEPPGGPLLRTLQGHAGEVSTLAVIPNGRRAVSGSSDCTLKVWDLESGAELATLKGHTSAVWAVAITPDGLRAVSGADDATLKVWDLESGEELATLQGHTSGVTAVAITPDGRQAVSGSDDATLKVWDLDSGVERDTLDEDYGYVKTVAITPDACQVVSGSSGHPPISGNEYYDTLKVWDLKSGEERDTLQGHASGVTAVAITPDGHRAVSGSSDQTLKVWDLESGMRLATLKGHASAVKAVAITPDGLRAVSGSSDHTLKLWDLESGEELAELHGHTHPVNAVAITPDGCRAVSGSSDHTLKVWDPNSDRLFSSPHGHASAVKAVAITLDGCRAVSGSGDATLKVWDVESGEEQVTLQGHAYSVNAVAITPDGRRAVSGSDDATLKVWDLDSGVERATLYGHSLGAEAVTITPDGRRAVSGSGDGNVKVWDLELAEELATLQGHDSAVRAVAITHDGRRAVSGSADRTLKVWDLELGAELAILKGHTNDVTAVAITPDGRRAVSGSGDATLKVWDVESGNELATLRGHTLSVNAVAITPDGRLAVSGSSDETLKVWNLDTLSIVAEFVSEAQLLCCSATSCRFVAGDLRGRVHTLYLVEC